MGHNNAMTPARLRASRQKTPRVAMSQVMCRSMLVLHQKMEEYSEKLVSRYGKLILRTTDIQELSLHTRHVADQKAFYCTTLGLSPLIETADSFTVQAGRTRLRFQESDSDIPHTISPLRSHARRFTRRKAGYSSVSPCFKKMARMKSFLPISTLARSTFVIRLVISSNILYTSI